MVELSPATTARLHRLFHPEHRADAVRLLSEGCAENLPLIQTPVTPVSLERLRFAAIRVSGGDLLRLREAIRIAQVDWRDLLVAADFAADTRAHERWEPRVLDDAVAERWKTERLAGVAFRPGDRVAVLWGPARGRKGTVSGLIGLEPEARYVVTLEGGEDTPAFQKMLDARR
jgi:hypothetical protein